MRPDYTLDDLEALTAVIDGTLEDELDSRDEVDQDERRLRVYKIPYQRLDALVNYPSILESTEHAPVTFMIVPGRLVLPSDAVIRDAEDNFATRTIDVLVWSQEFAPVPDGEQVPGWLVENIEKKSVVAADPAYYAEIERMANLWKEVLKHDPPKHSPSFRWVMRADSSMWLFRLCRFTYEVGYRRSPGWHAIQWTFGLVPTLYKFRREDKSWILRILGLRIHRKVCYGGRPD